MRKPAKEYLDTEPNRHLEAFPTYHARRVKHQFFTDEDLAEVTPFARLAYLGLLTVSDRHGNFPWKPKARKLEVLPYDDVDFESLMNELRDHRFLEQYEVEGRSYGHVRTWRKHQDINQREWNAKFAHPLDPQSAADPAIVKHERNVQGTCKHTPARVKHVSARASRCTQMQDHGFGSGFGSASASGFASGSGSPSNPPEGGGQADSPTETKTNGNNAGSGAGTKEEPSLTFDDLQTAWTEFRNDGHNELSKAMARTGFAKLEDRLRDLKLLASVDAIKRGFQDWLADRYVPSAGTRIDIVSPLAVFAQDVTQYLLEVQS